MIYPRSCLCIVTTNPGLKPRELILVTSVHLISRPDSTMSAFEGKEFEEEVLHDNSDAGTSVVSDSQRETEDKELQEANELEINEAGKENEVPVLEENTEGVEQGLEQDQPKEDIKEGIAQDIPVNELEIGDEADENVKEENVPTIVNDQSAESTGDTAGPIEATVSSTASETDLPVEKEVPDQNVDNSINSSQEPITESTIIENTTIQPQNIDPQPVNSDVTAEGRSPPDLPPRSPKMPPSLPPRSPVIPSLPPRNLSPEVTPTSSPAFLTEEVAAERLSGLQNQSSYNLLISRAHKNTSSVNEGSDEHRQQVVSGANTLRTTFNEIKVGIEYSNNNELMENIDWEFWSDVVNDYSSVVEKDPELLISRVSMGMPKEIRGMIWQLITNSKSYVLEELYATLKSEESLFGKAIKRDLCRTSFVTNSDMRHKSNELYQIIKAYSIFDPELGYTQGLAFIVVPLLMNMNESETFCLLVTLMKNYGFRDLYLPEMPGLHLKLFQFDRLLEDLTPEIASHLRKQGVQSSMYATQWFLTLFGYKFPLEIVIRIYDVVIAEGLETILRFAVNFMIQNRSHILTLKFDELLTFLKDGLFDVYNVENKSSAVTSNNYRLDDLVSDSLNLNIIPLSLNQYEKEFHQINQLDQERDKEISKLRAINGNLNRDIKKIEGEYLLLNKEHIEIANEMVEGKVRIANLEDENKQLKHDSEELDKRLASLSSQDKVKKDFDFNQQDLELNPELATEIQRTMERNAQVMEENRLLEEQLASLEVEYNEIKQEYEQMKLRKGKWGSSFKKVFGSK
ncbi:BA75_04280T0 [Komagataella pastoris]|uniref:BA75_04280T0 n=1 Tax=Komagataella pastoris TaxID=4922 RepID=A0A1B2JGZ4_PICPA|nr:BA75_04280T0 [Komagataella pastoris]